MILIFRAILILFYLLFIFIIGTLFCLLSPKNPNITVALGRFFFKLSPLIGVKVINRHNSDIKKDKQYVFIANHQNNYDLLIAGNIIEYNTVAVGKKSLLWIPFFGGIFWLAGNILIERNNRSKAMSTINQISKKMKAKKVSIWMFPEGTRSKGRGLLPFKSGAFHVAIDAGVPIVPICVSTTQNKINLNRLNNGYAIVEQLPPIDTRQYSKENVRELAAYCYDLMSKKIEELNEEVERLNNSNLSSQK